ncbi:MAG: aldehyde dehydrogenase family protein [Myxococcota bacterium]|mgnify:CR=1 FL=1
MDDRQIQQIVDKVMSRLSGSPASAPAPAAARGAADVVPSGRMGVHADVDSAVRAAREAYERLESGTMELRERIVAAMREVTRRHVRELSEYAQRETGLGRVEDKVKKNLLVANRTPGPEILRPPMAYSGDDGLTIEEHAPYGVIGAITPCTNPTETILCNGIGMVAGGNAVVFNVHPLAKRTSAWHVHLLNEAIVGAGGPPNLLTCVAEPSIESAGQLMKHPGTRIIVVTGGGEVVRAAMTCGKKTICGGPGNPPIVVDETADLGRAARGIIDGSSFDNNVICSDEKETIVVQSVADKLRAELKRLGAYELSESQTSRLCQVIFEDGGKHVNKRWVGKNANVILREIGISQPDECRIAFCDVDEQHPLVQHEQLMPIMPIVRVKDWEEAIACAQRAEHGFGHTAVMYSTHIEHMHRMARVINTCIFVKNAPSYAGLGAGGEGFTSWTIAHPTGEGLTTAVHFTRRRRCTLKDYFRIV